MPLLAGAESLSVWLADPTYPNTTLSWNMIHGKKVEMKTISFFILFYIYENYICIHISHILMFFLLQGTGMITQEIFRSSSYYVALGNLEQEEVEVFSYFDTILVSVAVLLSLE
jgi:hypothetical protein